MGRSEVRLNLKAHPYDYTDENSLSGADISRLEDMAILQEVAHGDQEALAELYRRFSSMLFGFLISLIHDPAAAEDLLQEVFLAVWTGAGRFRGASSVKTWMFNIAYKRSVSWLRKRRDLPIPEVDELLVEPGVEGTALTNIQNQAIRRALGCLPAEHRAVLELVFFYDCAYKEIAEIMDCPVGTVKSRMSHARRELLGILRIGELTGQGAG